MNRFVIGILAHVDAGKTTLSDTILYLCKSIRKPGRVDKKDSFLDSYALERERGITIFSKQAVFEYGNASFTLLDTPGHVDFSTEMERTLSVLDAAVLVVSGPEGVQAHTRTLWKLLNIYDIPTFIFVNKMDREVALKGNIGVELKKSLSSGCIEISPLVREGSTNAEKLSVMEELSLCDEEILENFLENGKIEDEEIGSMIVERKLFPVIYGSALKQEGVEDLLLAMSKYLPDISYDDGFAARVYKIGRDTSGKRVTYLKLTGGKLSNRDAVTYLAQGEEVTEKITEIRLYNGDKYENLDSATAGMVVGVTGLTRIEAGSVLGDEEPLPGKNIMPVLRYKVAENDLSKLRLLLPKLRELEEEEPELHVMWNDETKELEINVMGEIQLEILKGRFLERFGEDIEFDRGSIIYRETVTGPVLGIGHYEPLRHYAEVQLVIEPGAKGSGITFKSECTTSELDTNWQRLIMTHVYEKEHRGCLIGAPLDDVVITLVAGRAHLKHTEGGDFRQATYRAVRQGLMRAATSGKARILEPYYEFTLEVPSACIGRAMTDIDRKQGKITGHYESGTEGMAVLTGTAPVSEMMGYSNDVTAYTGGLGSFFCTFAGFAPCHNEEEVMVSSGYRPENDMRNPVYSVFCAHGAGFPVDWNEVDNYKHLDVKLKLSGSGESGWEAVQKEATTGDAGNGAAGKGSPEDVFVTTEEVDSIIDRTFFANKKQGYKNPFRKHKSGDALKDALKAASGSGKAQVAKPKEQLPKYLLVDGYNIIFAWEELKSLAAVNLDAARDRLNEILCNYRALTDSELIVVYDAYRVQGHPTEYLKFNNINIVFTKEAETADRFIERFAHENASRYSVTVATSDGLEQIIIRGQGALLLTAMDFYSDVKLKTESLREKYISDNNNKKTTASLAIIGHFDTIK
ncbi:MAG: TetM/TetW/TetO/TetS family tetracycline resistance ribosomal protection protein [Lachnospiraceae bacterium]|nr:TetM/TetW/TetO/TetS family tetracycline resistance ribosomal protection protein [Lachnospiraceae bacterium]